MLPTARFISYEGLDNCGKTTQIRKTGEYLKQRGIPVIIEREPGSTALGGALRRLLKDPVGVYKAMNAVFEGHNDFTPLDIHEERTRDAELFLFLAARVEFVHRVIHQQLLSGVTVLADRFMDSTEAYQGGGDAHGDQRVLDLIHTNHAYILNGNIAVPNLTFILDIPYSVMLERSHPSEHDFFERRGEDYFYRVRNQYRQIALQSPERVVFLNGTRSIDSLFKEGILPRVNTLFGLEQST